MIGRAKEGEENKGEIEGDEGCWIFYSPSPSFRIFLQGDFSSNFKIHFCSSQAPLSFSAFSSLQPNSTNTPPLMRRLFLGPPTPRTAAAAVGE